MVASGDSGILPASGGGTSCAGDGGHEFAYHRRGESVRRARHNPMVSMKEDP